MRAVLHRGIADLAQRTRLQWPHSRASRWRRRHDDTAGSGRSPTGASCLRWHLHQPPPTSGNGRTPRSSPSTSCRSPPELSTVLIPSVYLRLGGVNVPLPWSGYTVIAATAAAATYLAPPRAASRSPTRPRPTRRHRRHRGGDGFVDGVCSQVTMWSKPPAAPWATPGARRPQVRASPPASRSLARAMSSSSTKPTRGSAPIAAKTAPRRAGHRHPGRRLAGDPCRQHRRRPTGTATAARRAHRCGDAPGLLRRAQVAWRVLLQVTTPLLLCLALAVIASAIASAVYLRLALRIAARRPRRRRAW